MNLPTKEELDRAMIYEDKVPNYAVSSRGEKIQAGVILDDPNYSSFETDLKRENYISVLEKDDPNAFQIVVVGSETTQTNLIDTGEQWCSSAVQGQGNNTAN